jgi:hypothetical protein
MPQGANFEWLRKEIGGTMDFDKSERPIELATA